MLTRAALIVFVAGAALLAPAANQTFTGVITDSECATANHAAMQMGATDAECVLACIEAHGATFMLFDGTSAYGLSDQQTPAKLAARKVTVVGTLDAKTHIIQVESIAPAQ
jgi:hypothetical protein